MQTRNYEYCHAEAKINQAYQCKRNLDEDATMDIWKNVASEI